MKVKVKSNQELMTVFDFFNLMISILIDFYRLVSGCNMEMDC